MDFWPQDVWTYFANCTTAESYGFCTSCGSRLLVLPRELARHYVGELLAFAAVVGLQGILEHVWRNYGPGDRRL